MSATYTYNGDGLRVRTLVGGATTTYVWDLAASLPQVLGETGMTEDELASLFDLKQPL